MDAHDPFRPPRAQLEADEGADLGPPWRIEGTTLIVRNRTSLPNICVRTGEPAQQRRTQQLSWTPVWFKLLLFVATFIALLTYTTVRRTGTIEFALSDATARRRRRAILLGVVAVVGTVVLMSLPALHQNPEALLGIFVLGLIVLIVAVLWGRPFRVVKIDRFHVRLRITPQAAQQFARAFAAGPAVTS